MLLNRWDCHRRIEELSLWDCYIPASHLPRKWWVIRGIENPETVAQHEMDAAILTARFNSEISRIGGDVLIIQDTLLCHDNGEPKMILKDITPHCWVSAKIKREQEEAAIRDIYKNNPYMLRLWLESEDGVTLNWRIAKEIDKLQAIEKACYYEDTLGIPGLREEFFTYAVVTKNKLH